MLVHVSLSAGHESSKDARALGVSQPARVYAYQAAFPQPRALQSPAFIASPSTWPCSVAQVRSLAARTFSSAPKSPQAASITASETTTACGRQTETTVIGPSFVRVRNDATLQSAT